MPAKHKYRIKALKKLKKEWYIGILMVSFLTGILPSASPQCSGFARALSKPELSPYVHDGNFTATILGEGETVILRKTIFQGQKYRFVVKGIADLPPIHFRILHDNQILFDNARYDYASKWDFTAEATRTISIEVTVTEDDNAQTQKGGCVAILVGIDPNR